jgi:hypothetical protein
MLFKIIKLVDTYYFYLTKNYHQQKRHISLTPMFKKLGKYNEII